VDVNAAAEAIDADLRARGRPDRAAKERAYLKSDLVHYGASVPAIRAAVTSFGAAHPDLGHDDLVALAEVLWSAPVHERRMASVELLDLRSDLLGPSDVVLLERLLRAARTWALVDSLAASVVGPLVDRHPVELGPVLDRWAVDDDLWIRRSALLSLLLALRRGDGDFERFSRYADSMLEDREPFIRKAIGWVLRDTARKRPALVHDWLLPRVARASGVTLREALKPLSDEQRAAVLAAGSPTTSGAARRPRRPR
jgi:3-methyladenine DNA glycosylase AlkD